MLEFGKGALLALVANVLTIIGWFTMGPWIPSAANVLLALILTGIYGLEEKWRFVFGYWFVQLAIFVLWLTGLLSIASWISQTLQG